MGAPPTVAEAEAARVAEGGPRGAPALFRPLDVQDVLDRYALRMESGQCPVDHLAEFLRAEATAETEAVVSVLLLLAVDEINSRRASASSG